jgi:capsule polysaccharide export protein KpsE/RkpR
MRTKLSLPLAVITAALVVQAPAWAQRMPGMRGGGMFGGPMMAAYLGLTQEQLSDLKSMRSSQEATIRPLMQQMENYRQQLRQMTETTAPLDAGAVQNLAAEIAQLQAKLTVSRAQMEWQIFNRVLTSDQQAKLTSMQQQMQEMRQSWKNRHSTAESGGSQ